MTRTVKIVLRHWIPVVLLLVVMACESTDVMSAGHTSRVLRWIFSTAGIPISEASLALLNMILRKCGHFLGYGLLSAFTFRATRTTAYALAEAHGRMEPSPWKFQWALTGWVLATLTATADELHQMTIPSRTGMFHDIVLDSCGAIFAQILIMWFLTRRRNELQYE